MVRVFVSSIDFMLQNLFSVYFLKTKKNYDDDDVMSKNVPRSMTRHELTSFPAADCFIFL